MSGKSVTLGVLAGLLIVGGWLSYCLWCYQKLDDARADSKVAWRGLAEVLLARYSAAELKVASGVDDESLSMASGEKFQLALDRFRTTSQHSLQQQSATEMESLLSEFELGNQPSTSLQDLLVAFNSASSTEEQVLNQPGTRFLSMFMKFQQPIQVELAN